MSKDDEITAFFNRHLVPLHFTFEKAGEKQDFIVTAFILSISNHWFLITAGHCIRDIDDLSKKYGYKMVSCELIDSLGENAKYYHSVPFVYEDAHPFQLGEEYDYGIIGISDYYKNLLLSNNVQALTEDVWKKQPNKPDLHILLGIPSELNKFDSGAIQFAPLLLVVEPLNFKPDGFAETEIPLFYGQINLMNEVTSLKGVSGGLIFAFQKDETGVMRYWLIALQSRWLPSSHYIAAYPTMLLGNFLEDIIIKLQKS